MLIIRSSSLFFLASLFLNTPIAGAGLPTCESIAVYKKQLSSGCTNFCVSDPTAVFDRTYGPNATDPLIYNEWGCNCLSGCRTVDVLFNTSAPLTTCKAKKILTSSDCVAFCVTLGQDMKSFTGTTGASACSCTNADACNDEPTCQQLNVVPRNLADGCVSICENSTLVNTSTWMDVVVAGNQNNTAYLKYECTCPAYNVTKNVSLANYVAGCHDEIVLTPSLTRPPTCTSLNVTDPRGCQTFCDSYGLFYTDTTPNIVTTACSCFAEGGPQVAVCNNTVPSTPNGGLSGAAAGNSRNGYSMMLLAYIGLVSILCI